MKASAPFFSLFFLALAARIRASPVAPNDAAQKLSYSGYIHPSNGKCSDHNLKLTITYPSRNWAYGHFRDSFDVAAYLFNASSNIEFLPFGTDQPQDKTETFEVAATYCVPVNKTKEKAALLLTHGVGFDRRYVKPISGLVLR